MLQQLTPLQVFNAMHKFFIIYYNETGSGIIIGTYGTTDYDTKTGNISIMLGTMGFDEGMWEIWIESLDKVLLSEDIKNHDCLTPLQAFKAIPLYLEGFYRVNSFEDIMAFVSDLKLVINNESTDAKLWKQWIQCVNEVISAGDSDYRYRIYRD